MTHTDTTIAVPDALIKACLIHDFMTPEWEAALAGIQMALGVEDGSAADHYFNEAEGKIWNQIDYMDRYGTICGYIRHEQKLAADVKAKAELETEEQAITLEWPVLKSFRQDRKNVSYWAGRLAALTRAHCNKAVPGHEWVSDPIFHGVPGSIMTELDDEDLRFNDEILRPTISVGRGNNEGVFARLALERRHEMYGATLKLVVCSVKCWSRAEANQVAAFWAKILDL